MNAAAAAVMLLGAPVALLTAIMCLERRHFPTQRANGYFNFVTKSEFRDVEFAGYPATSTDIGSEHEVGLKFYITTL